MYAITFDMDTNELKKENLYPQAYDEIKRELLKIGFEWIQGSVYTTKENENSLTKVYQAIDRLKSIEWFKKSVRDIRSFKIEDFSNFTFPPWERIISEAIDRPKPTLDFVSALPLSIL